MGGTAYVNLTPRGASDGPTFVMRVPQRGALKLLAAWTYSSQKEPRVIVAADFHLDEQDHGRVFSKSEIAWPFTWRDLAATDWEAMRAKIEAFFMAQVNPLLTAAYLPAGREDQLLQTATPTVAHGTFEDLKALLQDLTATWDSAFSQFRGDDFSLSLCCAYENHKAIAITGDPGLKKFVDDIVLPIYQPEGEGYAYNDGPSHSKSGYSLSGHFTECLREDISAHDTIESRTRVIAWLKEHGHPDGEAVLQRYEHTSE
jgi:hypothetical protein